MKPVTAEALHRRLDAVCADVVRKTEGHPTIVFAAVVVRDDRSSETRITVSRPYDISRIKEASRENIAYQLEDLADKVRGLSHPDSPGAPVEEVAPPKGFLGRAGSLAGEILQQPLWLFLIPWFGSDVIDALEGLSLWYRLASCSFVTIFLISVFGLCLSRVDGKGGAR